MDISLPAFVRRIHTDFQKRIHEFAKTNPKAQSDQILKLKFIRKIAATLALGAGVSLGFQQLKEIEIQQNLNQQIFQTSTLEALLRTKGLRPIAHRTGIRIQNKLSDDMTFEASGQHFWISESLPRVVAIRSFVSGQSQWMIYSVDPLQKTEPEFGTALQGLHGFVQLEQIPILQQSKSSNPAPYRDPLEIVF